MPMTILFAPAGGAGGGFPPMTAEALLTRVLLRLRSASGDVEEAADLMQRAGNAEARRRLMAISRDIEGEMPAIEEARKAAQQQP
jgi:hypothetical protein